MRPARRTVLATLLLTAPLVVVAIVAVSVMSLPVGYLVAMLSLLAVIMLGLLRQRRWGWWLGVVMGSIWVIGGLVNFLAVVTGPLLWADPWLAPLLAVYVLSLASGLALLLSRAGRAVFRRRSAAAAPPAP